MTQPTQSQSVITRELARLGRPRRYPIHPGYAAIVAKAHELSLPQCSATDITILDRRLIVERQPRQFAWLLHHCGSLLSHCPFNARQSPGEGLPVMVVDEEIYHRLPSLLIATLFVLLLRGFPVCEFPLL